MSYSANIEETYLAVVTANQDPDQEGKIRVACQALLDGEDQDLPQWVKPYLQWGWFVVPDVGETVEIVAVTAAGDDEQPGMASIANMNLRWRGARIWNQDQDTPRPVPDDFKTNYGKRRGFATPIGHIIWFDDTEGQEAITLQWTNKGGDKAMVSVDQNGSMVLTSKNGATLAMDSSQKTLLLADENSNSVKMDNTGIVIQDANGNKVTMDASGVKVDAGSNNVQVLSQSVYLQGQSGVTIDAGASNVTVNAASVALGAGASHGAGFGDQIQTYLSSHVHTSAAPGSPTSPPTVPPTGLASTTVTLA